jgi:clan AA aspartic protease
MIIGKFIDKKITLPVNFLLSTDTILSIEFVVDTGFNGYLTLPVNAVGALNLPLFSTIITILADGTHAEIPTHVATIDWHDSP